MSETAVRSFQVKRFRVIAAHLTALCITFVAGGSAEAWRLGGELKLYGSATDLEQEWMAGKRWLLDGGLAGRLRAEIEPADWLALIVEYRLGFLWGDSIRFEEFMAAIPGLQTERELFFDLEAVLSEDENLRLGHELDRCWVQVRAPVLDISIGRRALSWGSGFSWNPVDLINPFSPTDFDKDVKPGGDMVLVEAPLGALAEIAIVGKPVRTGETRRFDGDASALLVRGRINAGGVDLALVGGEFRTDSVAGITVNGTLHGAGLWLEATYTHPENRGDFIRAVTGLSYMFSGGSVLSAEYYFTDLGAAEKDDYMRLLADHDFIGRLQRGEIYNLGRHYVSLSISRELTPLTQGAFNLLVNLGDGSFFAGPSLQKSLSQNSVLELFGGVSAGASGTEFGGFTLESMGSDKTIPVPNTIAVKLSYFW